LRERVRRERLRRSIEKDAMLAFREGARDRFALAVTLSIGTAKA